MPPNRLCCCCMHEKRSTMQSIMSYDRPGKNGRAGARTFFPLLIHAHAITSTPIQISFNQGFPGHGSCVYRSVHSFALSTPSLRFLFLPSTNSSRAPVRIVKSCCNNGNSHEAWENPLYILSLPGAAIIELRRTRCPHDKVTLQSPYFCFIITDEKVMYAINLF